MANLNAIINCINFEGKIVQDDYRNKLCKGSVVMISRLDIPNNNMMLTVKSIPIGDQFAYLKDKKISPLNVGQSVNVALTYDNIGAHSLQNIPIAAREYILSATKFTTPVQSLETALETTLNLDETLYTIGVSDLLRNFISPTENTHMCIFKDEYADEDYIGFSNTNIGYKTGTALKVSNKELYTLLFAKYLGPLVLESYAEARIFVNVYSSYKHPLHDGLVLYKLYPHYGNTNRVNPSHVLHEVEERLTETLNRR